MSERIAIFGGTYDPVHVGHLFVADEVLFAFDYDRIVFVPTHIPPHKEAAAVSGGDRVEMLRRAVSGNPRFAVEEYEIARAGVSYTIDTVRHLLEQGDVQGKPGLILGSDLVSGFEQWREPDELERITDLIVVQRPGSDAAGFSRRHSSIRNMELDISSSAVRERIREGRPFRYLLPERVVEYIETNGLYL